jgi:hypothetical protein
MEKRSRFKRCTRSCEECRRRKIVCRPDDEDPGGPCARCVKANKECIFPARNEDQGTEGDKEYVQRLEDRVRHSKAAIHSVETEDEEGIKGAGFTSEQTDSVLKEGEGRGRTQAWGTWGRANSPNYYSANKRTRSESPASSFYHDESPAIVSTPPIGSDLETSFWPSRSEPDSEPAQLTHDDTSFQQQQEEPGTSPRTDDLPYQYIPLAENEIRLLRIDPGPLKRYISCSLKVIRLEKLATVTHEFQALSYAWGHDCPDHKIYLSDLPRSGDGSCEANPPERPYYIRKNLHQALKRIRRTNHYSWIWCDALCIEQTNESEKSQQIPKMPDIYSSAWNVIAWLGDDEAKQHDIHRAIGLIPVILNLKTLDSILLDRTAEEEMLRCWVSFGHLLQRQWFQRRWVIQEVACARRLSVRIADKILSWLDFADAVDLYLENIDRIRTLYRRSALYLVEPTALDGLESSKAVALMNFSRNVFWKSPGSEVVSRSMNLERLVLAASSFAVSDVRDIVYALLYLANDRHDAISIPIQSPKQHGFTSDYAKHPVDIFIDFARYSMTTSNALDIICRPWASWPHLERHDELNGRTLPTWIKVATFGEDGPDQHHVSPEDLLGSVDSQLYDASRGVAMRAHTLPPTVKHVLQVEGIFLSTVETVSASTTRKGVLKNNWLRLLGWNGALNEGIDDRLWRTLVANRSPDGKTAPTWYRRACALALTHLDEDGVLDTAALVADTSQPSTLIDYLKRVQSATNNRKIFRCAGAQETGGPVGVVDQTVDSIVGIGPDNMGAYTHLWVCILFGCSVPVILGPHAPHQDFMNHAVIVGACYVHGHMEGEMFAGMSEEAIRKKTTTFSIH